MNTTIQPIFSISPKDLLGGLRSQFDRAKLDPSVQKSINDMERVFGSIDDLINYYVEPFGQNVNPADSNDEDSGLVAITPVFQMLAAYLAGRNRFTHAWILSDAGMGKTSLLIMLRLAWLAGLFTSPAPAVVLLKIGSDTIGAITEIERPSETILLLDALDEDRDAWDHFTNRLQLLLRSTQHFRKVLITCRTQFFPNEDEEAGKAPGEISLAGFHCSKLFLSPFNDDQVVEYLQRRFSDVNTQQRAMATVMEMRSLRFRPMLLTYVDFLLDRVVPVSSDAYSIYEALVDEWLNRELRKRMISSKPDIDKVCSAIAIELYATKARTIDFAKLREIYAPVERSKRSLEYMTVEGRSLLHRTSDGQYKFAHYSILEFFIARELADSPRPWLNTDQVKYFLTDAFRIKRSKNFEGLDLSQATIRDITPTKASFKQANLSNARMENVVLRRATFERANIKESTWYNARLDGSDLGDTRFESVFMEDVSLEECRLVNVLMNSCRGLGVSYDGSDFTGASFSTCKFDAPTFRRCKIVGAAFIECTSSIVDLYEAKIANTSFRKSKMRSVSVDRAQITDCEFVDCEWIESTWIYTVVTNSTFTSAQLRASRWVESKLRQVSLSNAELEEAEFQRVQFGEVSFSGSSTRGLKISDSDCRALNVTRCQGGQCEFVRSNFHGLIGAGCKLEGSVFAELDLSEAQLAGSAFNDSKLTECVMVKSNLHKSSFRKAQLVNCILDFANLRETDFDEAHLNGLKATQASGQRLILTGAVVINSSFMMCDLSGLRIQNAKVTSTTWEGCSLKESLLNNSVWRDCKLVGVDLSKGDLTAADFSTTEFEGVNISGCIYSSQTRWPKGFTVPVQVAFGPGCKVKGFRQRGQTFAGVEFVGASFTSCTLAESDFTRANLEGASIVDSNMERATFTKANLSRTTFRDVSLENALLIGTDLTGASFERCRMNGALYDDDTKLPSSDFRPEELGLVKRKALGSSGNKTT